jgi:hypothetical protein
MGLSGFAPGGDREKGEDFPDFVEYGVDHSISDFYSDEGSRDGFEVDWATTLGSYSRSFF